MDTSPNKENPTVTGIVVEALRGAAFRVKLDDDKELLAYASGKIRLHHIKILPGDKVIVETTKYDEKRGRITRRL
ncbi:MAG: translation initiation factor IF-1 [Candidatus Colwellbacteria bacterium RIFCSPLOWO2_01_FULL_48_10]|uniref:Translation initiation factor IF-1 n=1 Tax=Candidatus Colwellbacteria bacterium RIFCSPLOWO2_01_FULL_48_10 TaxID=1797690 RepID=A0A1G1Z703_9BACT|nr:MAG: translation initiation factor IF-1 [Candidatus Colwellbacteria bacterium RIFCSPLOWO2_01_FULL_48_10]